MATTFALGAESNRLPACIDSAPARSLLFFVVDSVCLYVCLFVCLSVTLLQIDSSSLFLDGIQPFLGHQFSMTKATKRCFSNFFFFFVSRRNPAIFWPSFLHLALYKTLFLDFWFRSPNDQNLLPKICNCTKSPMSACMTDRPEMYGPTRGFSGIADSMEPCKMLWGRPLLPWQRHLA